MPGRGVPPYVRRVTFRPQTTALPRAAFAALLAVAWSAITLAALGHFHTGLSLAAGAGAFLVVLFMAPGRRFDRLDLAALGARARQWVAANRSWTMAVQPTVGLYERLTGRRDDGVAPVQLPFAGTSGVRTK